MNSVLPYSVTQGHCSQHMLAALQQPPCMNNRRKGGEDQTTEAQGQS